MSSELSPFLLARKLKSASQRFADREAIQYQQGDQWLSLNWQQVTDKSDSLAAALLQLGIEVQDKVGIFAGNCLEWFLTDMACLKTRAVNVPIYGTSTSEQAQYIINDAQIKVLFVGDQNQYDVAVNIATNCSSLTTLVLMSSAITPHRNVTIRTVTIEQLLETDASTHQNELEQRFQALQLDDLFTLIYTSGTTGEPKGVMLTHKNMASMIEQHSIAVPLEENALSLCFLPLSHVYERGWSNYVLSSGGRVAVLSDPSAVQQALTEVKPEMMCAVPRLFEKIHSAIISKVAKAPLHKRLLFSWCLRQGRRQFNANIKQRRRALISRLLFALADKLVLAKLRAALGGNLKLMSAGGARLDQQVNQFFQYIGIPLLNGYGATETTATATCNQIHDRRTAGVGKPLPKLQIRIGENDEILVKGDTVMAGYYNRPADTAAAFIDGWYKTGDAGYLDKDNHLHITDRIKELMKTSNGKYIAPQRVEGMLTLSPMIEQVAVIADGRNFASALIVPDFVQLQEWAIEQSLRFRDNAELVKLPEVVGHYQLQLSQHQSELARYEQVKQFTLLERPFSMDHGEITPTLKLRRKVINEVFVEEIEAMYQRKH
ncbi:AMP-dependent synthetase/ligase [Ferrimonas lipolytica]|uniref:Long-chain fatty acid--CoA ligase n=1 Tax=Ferrimonas lipolytica TaxID=2724191 RepID=A0A6H1UFG1_9GAMM|nr:long-chain fatty acid--CoA ligase [Ferrimonas lipolytica]QIZ77784.1 long-chain fatty acid--CoA ligase [Ferrimonas lipolytica]